MNVANSNMPTTATAKTGSAEKAQVVVLEKRLKEAMDQKETTEATVKSHQDELEKLRLLGTKKTAAAKQQRPPSRDTVAEIDEQIATLELERTINSMSLAAERDILKRIHKLGIARREAVERAARTAHTQQHRAALQSQRAALSEQRAEISELQIELGTVGTAAALGCRVGDLVGVKVACPADKLAAVIGRQGRNVQNLRAAANVSVDIVVPNNKSNKKKKKRNSGDDAEQEEAAAAAGDIHLIGTLESLDKAVSNLDKVMSQTEEAVEFLPDHAAAIRYLTSAKIAALAQLRERHPGVQFSVYSNNNQQQNRSSSNNKNSSSSEDDSSKAVRVRGTVADICAFRSDALRLSASIVSAELQLTSREAGLLVGKAGATIAGLVETHQAAIDVQKKLRQKEANSKKKKEQKGETTTPADTSAVADELVLTKVTILGPCDNVEAAKAEIQAMIETNKDREASVPMDPHVKAVLLLNNGAGIQALHKKANEATKLNNAAAAAGDAESNTNNYVAVNVNNDAKGLTVKGKAKALECALKVVKEEISRIESSMLIKIKVDPFVIPVMIGKGGQGIKDLKEGTKTVYLDVDREAGQVAVCGLEQDEVDKVVAAIKAVIADHHVQRLRLEWDDDTSSANSFSTQFRALLRSAAVIKEVKELAFMMADDDAKRLVLRGKPDSVAKAATLVNEFLAQNFMQELVVSAEDMSALLTGGKKSKIAELAASNGVNLSTDRSSERNAVIAKGEKEKVVGAMKAVREFLYGSDVVAVSKISLAAADLMGVVIGKGGKTKADLQAKFPSVSIIVHRTDAAITLRGQREQVEQCHVEIMKLILSASITRTTDLSEEQAKDVNKTKFNRRIGQLLPAVQVSLSTTDEKSSITFRGPSSDVQMALSLLKEQLEGVYESRMQLGSTLFKKVQDACRNPAHLDRIEKQASAKVSLDDKTDEIVLSGKRETVKAAKEAILTFFDFLFGPNTSRCDIPGPAFAMVGKSATVAEVAAKTGAQVIVDHDLNAILLFSSETDKVKEASAMIDAKVAEVEALVYVWQLGVSEDWLVSSIIGKSGETVKKLRKQTGCTIDVDSKERRVIVSSSDSELVVKAKVILDELVNKSRKECVFIAISQQDMPAFVGRAGANIKGLAEQHGVEVQIMKNPVGAVRITGGEEKVAAAKTAVEEWLATRAEALKDAEAEESKRLKANQIPVVIGAKGATIRGLEREFGCKIDIDRKTSTVTVKGGSSVKRAALLEKMDKLIAEDAEKPASDAAQEGQSETDSVKENKPVPKPESKAERTKRESTEKPVMIAAPKPKAAPIAAPMTASDFPALVSNDCNTVKASKTATGSHWAPVVSSSSSSSVEEPPEEHEAKESQEATYVGDVIEEAAKVASTLEQMD